MADGSDRMAGALVRILPVALVDHDGRVQLAGGDACGGIAGHEPDALCGRLLFELVHPDDLVDVVDGFVGIRDHRLTAADVRSRMRGPDGAYRDVSLLMHEVADRPDVLIWCRDVTAGAMAQEALRVTTLPSALVEQTRTMLAVFEANGELRYLNPAALHALCPVDEHDLTGVSLLDLVHPDDVDIALDTARIVASAPRQRAACTLRILTDTGCRRFDIQLLNLTHDPAVLGIVAEGIDVTDRAEMEAALLHQALHDPLTGLANRVLMRDRLAHELGRLRRGGAPLMVAYLDLDDFKAVNDTRGHDVGDLVLSALARQLAASVRPGDTVARVGGDEFVVVCPDVAHAPAADVLARRITEALSAPVEIDGCRCSFTASVGVVLVDHPVATSELLRRADATMYRAKATGKGRVARAELL